MCKPPPASPCYPLLRRRWPAARVCLLPGPAVVASTAPFSASSYGLQDGEARAMVSSVLKPTRLYKRRQCLALHVCDTGTPGAQHVRSPRCATEVRIKLLKCCCQLLLLPLEVLKSVDRILGQEPQLLLAALQLLSSAVHLVPEVLLGHPMRWRRHRPRQHIAEYVCLVPLRRLETGNRQAGKQAASRQQAGRHASRQQTGRQQAACSPTAAQCPRQKRGPCLLQTWH